MSNDPLDPKARARFWIEFRKAGYDIERDKSRMYSDCGVESLSDAYSPTSEQLRRCWAWLEERDPLQWMPPEERPAPAPVVAVRPVRRPRLPFQGGRFAPVLTAEEEFEARCRAYDATMPPRPEPTTDNGDTHAPEMTDWIQASIAHPFMRRAAGRIDAMNVEMRARRAAGLPPKFWGKAL